METFMMTVVTVPNEAEGVRIARSLVEERLAACVNVIPRIRSVYHWKGEICEDSEGLLLIKTRAGVYPRLQERVRRLHPYEVPEVIGFAVSEGLPDYLSWVFEETKAARS